MQTSDDDLVKPPTVRVLFADALGAIVFLVGVAATEWLTHKLFPTELPLAAMIVVRLGEGILIGGFIVQALRTVRAIIRESNALWADLKSGAIWQDFRQLNARAVASEVRAGIRNGIAGGAVLVLGLTLTVLVAQTNTTVLIILSIVTVLILALVIVTAIQAGITGMLSSVSSGATVVLSFLVLLLSVGALLLKLSGSLTLVEQLLGLQ